MSKPVHMRKGVNYSGNSFSATYADSVIGTILAYGGTTAPYGWFLCQGQAISRTEYHELFEVIGTSFGAGDGSTTFNLPDLRGEFLRGVGNNSHTNQGNGGTVGQHQDGTEMPAVNKYASNANLMYVTKNSKTPANTDYRQTGATFMYFTKSSESTGSDDYTDWFTSRPTNTSVNFIIKAKYSATPAGDVLGVQDIRDTLGETPIPSDLGTTVTGALNTISDWSGGFIDVSNKIANIQKDGTWVSGTRTISYTATENCAILGYTGINGVNADIVVTVGNIVLTSMRSSVANVYHAPICPIFLKQGQQIKFTCAVNTYINLESYKLLH